MAPYGLATLETLAVNQTNAQYYSALHIFSLSFYLHVKQNTYI